MAAEKAGAAEGAKDEVDVVRAAIYFLGILLVGLSVVLWVLLRQRDAFRDAVSYGDKNLKAMAAQYEGVAGLLKQYKESGADEARRETRTWLGGRFKAAGIPEGKVITESWKERPQKEFIENYVDVVVKDQPLDRLVHFLWNVERMSTKMRTIEMRLSRSAPNNAPETDNWELKAAFGYREPRGRRD
jgi:hypothetical protein